MYSFHYNYKDVVFAWLLIKKENNILSCKTCSGI